VPRLVSLDLVSILSLSLSLSSLAFCFYLHHSDTSRALVRLHALVLVVLIDGLVVIHGREGVRHGQRAARVRHDMSTAGACPGENHLLAARRNVVLDVRRQRAIFAEHAHLALDVGLGAVHCARGVIVHLLRVGDALELLEALDENASDGGLERVVGDARVDVGILCSMSRISSAVMPARLSWGCPCFCLDRKCAG